MTIMNDVILNGDTSQDARTAKPAKHLGRRRDPSLLLRMSKRQSDQRPRPHRVGLCVRARRGPCGADALLHPRLPGHPHFRGGGACDRRGRRRSDRAGRALLRPAGRRADDPALDAGGAGAGHDPGPRPGADLAPARGRRDAAAPADGLCQSHPGVRGVTLRRGRGRRGRRRVHRARSAARRSRRDRSRCAGRTAWRWSFCWRRPPPRNASLRWSATRRASSTWCRWRASPARRTNYRPTWPRSSIACARRDRLPLAVGFGIATPEHAAAVGAFADGVIVGSALIKAVGTAAEPAAAAGSFVRALSEALRRATTMSARLSATEITES